MINQLNNSNPIVEKDGTMIRRFSDWTKSVTRLQILTGTGSPEGIIEALQRVLYMDDEGTAGAILYIKRDADISGDRTQGWILV